MGVRIEAGRVSAWAAPPQTVTRPIRRLRDDRADLPTAQVAAAGVARLPLPCGGQALKHLVQLPGGDARCRPPAAGHGAVVLAIDDGHQTTDALADPTPIPSDLTVLHWVISEASLPDVDSGNFIHPPATATEHLRECGPAPIDGEPIALVFAGGGHLFAIGDSGQVCKSNLLARRLRGHRVQLAGVSRTARPPDRAPDLFVDRGRTGPCSKRPFTTGGREQVWGHP